MSEREEEREREVGGKGGLDESRHACERLEEVMVICKLRFRALEDLPSI